ncbi:LPS-assembly protein LptD [Larsenimonas rhizosphaerae]|uniref:LPS-assembly protein LptD n=1 Tax=Larsenimonas rhizosphaerae TaxID=2944682 RepID=A0AA41ZJD1_9GAMM|nr:LPS assembly protein LptD [Larsenimonas rhizosphaerae]MCM2130179.1 LPS assembly protein LptD [Larsenimonas rhizosphaerae]MCX2522866.1 LPS assembly protein LptD [Larsenimonas rhizosphaerae]
MGQRTFWTAALTGVLAGTAHAAPPATLSADQLDWQPWGEDRPADALCRGRYVMPAYRIGAGQTPSQVRSSSDSAGYGSSGETILNGDVVLRRGNQQVEAPQVSVNQDRTNAHVSGPLAWRANGALVRGDSADIALNSDAAQVDSAHYVFHSQHSRGDAQSLARLKDGRYQLREASFTTCDPQSSLWRLIGSNVVLDRENGYGTATNARLEIEDIPVFYWPWLSFPLDDRRHTGALWPLISYGSSDGLDYSQPIYLNLAPNYDATLTPRYIQNRGAMLGGEFRYLFGTDKGAIAGAYLGSDEGGDNPGGDDSHKDQDRWYINYTHSGRFSERTRYDLKYGAASDGDYFDDFGQSFDEIDTDYLERLARLDYQGDVWHLQGRARGFQKMDYPLADDDKPFYELPALLAQARWDQSSGTYEEWNSTATYFWRDIDRNDVPLRESATGSRIHFAPAVGYRGDNSWGFFEPRAELWYSQYDLDYGNRNEASLDGRDESPSVAAPVLSVDSGLIFERDFSAFDSRWRQTLEPRLYYAYVPERDQDDMPVFDTNPQSYSWNRLWSPYRFTGSDRIGDVNKLSYGVSSRFLEDATGRERLKLSLGQSRYFDDREVNDNDPSKNYDDPNSQYYYNDHREYSPAVAQVDWQLTRRWSARYAMLYDTERGRTEQNSTYLRYRDPGGSIVNLGYRWEVQGFDPAGDSKDRLGYNRNEYDLSFAWKATAGVSLIGRYLYDETNSRALEKLAGVQFNDCCYGVEVAWREWIDDDDSANTIVDDETKRGIFLRFIFKGLGGIGQDPDPYFSEAVPGYQPGTF